MTKRVFNFSAGPAMLPLEVLEASAQALVDYQGKGFGIAECSHRGKEFDGVLDEAIARCQQAARHPRHPRRAVPAGRRDPAVHHHPDELPHRPRRLRGRRRVVEEGRRRRQGRLRRQDPRHRHRARRPTSIARPRAGPPIPAAAYLHVCSNETVHGHRLAEWPQPPEPDRRRQLRDDVAPPPRRAHRPGLRRRAEEPGPVGRGAGHRAQGPLRPHPQERAQDLQLQGAGRGQELPQHAAHLRRVHAARDLPLDGAPGRPGGAWRSATPRRRKLIYDAIDGSGGFYTGTVADKAARSHMNVTFRLPSEELTEKFVKEAVEQGHGGAQGLPHRRRHPRVHLQRHAGRGLPGAGRAHEGVRQGERVDRLQRRAAGGARVPMSLAQFADVHFGYPGNEILTGPRC